MPLLLSPAGSMASLKAAIDAGCDEVFLGGNDFNARINASNFDRSALARAGEICRNANVGLHITLNTLIYDREFGSVSEYVDFLCREVGPDALIVQDAGLAYILRRDFPNLALHASTQMRIHSALEAENLQKMGFTRAVIARELSKEDIESFAKSGLETEIFVHGAICVSESGGCLMSSVIGNRSGNRGECAQPCRLPYKGKNRFPLSLKDMCLANHIKEICDIGVTSLKIEGRMKSPDYVGAVTSVYRRLIDENRNANDREMRYLADVFSRSGFTDGYFKSRINVDMFGIRREEDKRSTAAKDIKIPKAAKRPKRSNPLPSPMILPERNEDKVLHPKFQKGLVLRFEGKIPSKEFLERHFENVARIDIPLAISTDQRFAPFKEKISVIIPRTIFKNELAEVKKQISDARNFGICHATVSSLYQAELCDGFFIHGDYALNVVNRNTIELLDRYSFSSIMLSPETDGKFSKGSKSALEYIGYGRTPLMYTRTCIICNIEGCQKKKKCISKLVDRTGAFFPVISAHNHTNIIYNSLPAYRLDRKAELKKCGVGLLTLLFTTETEREMDEIIAIANTKEKPKFQYTRR